MPSQQIPPCVPGKTATQGEMKRVPCPWCRKPIDFSAHADESQGGSGWGSQGLEGGAKVDCDHCGRTSKILAVKQITVVQLVAWRK